MIYISLGISFPLYDSQERMLRGWGIDKVDIDRQLSTDFRPHEME